MKRKYFNTEQRKDIYEKMLQRLEKDLEHPSGIGFCWVFCQIINSDPVYMYEFTTMDFCWDIRKNIISIQDLPELMFFKPPKLYGGGWWFYAYDTKIRIDILKEILLKLK